jgi:hypothetical protein
LHRKKWTILFGQTQKRLAGLEKYLDFSAFAVDADDLFPSEKFPKRYLLLRSYRF